MFKTLCLVPVALALNVADYEQLHSDGDATFRAVTNQSGVDAAATTWRLTVTFSRTVSDVASGWSGKLEFAEGCADEDDWGSNNCAWSWGDSLDISGDLAAGADVGEGATIDIDAKVDSIVPFKATCPACGANCTLTIPVVKQDVTFAMPDCPLVSASTPLSFSTTAKLPGTSPTPTKISVTGSVTLNDASGSALMKMDLDATVDAS